MKTAANRGSTWRVRRRQPVRAHRTMSVILSIWTIIELMTGHGRAQLSPPPVLALDVVAGIPGTQLFAGLGSQSGQQATNGYVIVIGESSYVVLRPETNALLALATTESTNVITMRVYSREFLYDFIAEDSTLTNGRNSVAVGFAAKGGVIYDVQLNGVGDITLTYKLGFPPMFSQSPGSQAVAAGCTASMSAATTGLPAPTLQWSFNGLELPGETNATLTIQVAQVSDNGTYRVRASNFLGIVTSLEADLDVVSSAIESAGVTPAGHFQFTVTGLPGQGYAIETSSDLSNWSALSTNSLSANGSFTFTHAQRAEFSSLFFRARTICLQQ